MKLHRYLCVVILAVVTWSLSGAVASAQLTADQQADMLLNTARKAHNERNYGLATAKFREYLAKFADKKDAPSARYGLALTLIDGPEKKFDEARDILQALAGVKDFPDRALAAYYAAVANRGLGLQDLAKADATPNDAPKYRASAQQHFTSAIPQFQAAVTAFLARIDSPVEKDKLSHNAEWLARARCDLAEMQLRIGKAKEAQATVTLFVADPIWTKSQYTNLGRYYHGYASVLLKEHAAAQKSLSALTPFTDPLFGNHARYLLARTHHLGDDRAEATTHYEGTIADYQKSKAEAIKMLAQPQIFQNDPEIRARLEFLTKNPVPDHVARATFYLGVLHYEGGKFVDARTRFAEFVKQFPQSALRNEAEIRIGYCQVQLKEYPDAIKTLTPLIDKDARLADQVLFWFGKAQAGTAPEASVNQVQHNQVISAAINTLRAAADRAQKLVDVDPDAKMRRGEILLELADQMQRIWQNKEAAAVYNQLLTEKVLAEREEEISQRLTNALHLAGDHGGSDSACVKFQERFPQGTLMPAVLFVYAENSFFRMMAAEKNPNAAERAKELPIIVAETVKRFQKVIEKYPEFPKINVARYSLGLTYYRTGDLTNALKALNEIPGPDRSGELAMASYLIGDCLLRQAPTAIPDDALAAGKLEEQLKSAAQALEAFIGGQPKDPNLPDALLRYGLCQQRLAGLVAQPQERAKKFNEARATYERLMRKETDFTASPLQTAQATFERAKCITLAGDMNTGINELRKFTNDPLKQSVVAPQAMLQLATWLRTLNRQAEAVDAFAKNRDFLEAMLAKDPEKEKATAMIALLRYHHGVALREFDKLPEAREMFETVAKMGVQRVEGTEAALRVGQCLKDEGQIRLDNARKMQLTAKKPEEIAQVQKVNDEGYKFIRDSVAYLESQAEQVKANPALQEARGRMLYDAAWGARILAEPEIAAAKAVLQQEIIKKLNSSSQKFTLPEVSLDKVPLQASEKRARTIYKTLIDSVGDLTIVTEARFELAEMLAQRNEHDGALALLNEVLDKEPSVDMTEKIRLRLGSIHAAKGNLKGALQQFDAVTSNPKSQLVGWAQYRAGEALIHNQQYADAVKRLSMFRDQVQWQNVSGLSDRALMRLGFAYAQLKSWDESRVAYQRLVIVFPSSIWVDEGRYGIGWALHQKKDLENAANAYSEVVARTATDLAAKAQMQIGLCRMEQKRYLDAANAFLVIPSTYDYPDLRAAAILKAGEAYLELKQVDRANRQFERVLREFPGTPWADAAKEKLK